MIGVDTTDVKDLIMDQIQDLVKTDKVADVGAMADYVKFIFSKFNSCIGNKTTGTLFKLTGRVISLKTWLAIGEVHVDLTFRMPSRASYLARY
jgi:hypothetical protein